MTQGLSSAGPFLVCKLCYLISRIKKDLNLLTVSVGRVTVAPFECIYYIMVQFALCPWEQTEVKNGKYKGI
jgi:hypothetical protein